jgi:type VI secretion system ImpC/EvpB family protein
MARDDVAFDLVVLADLVPGRAEPARARRVDRDELAALFSTLAPQAMVAGTRLAFRDFRDLRPEALAAALPATRGLLALRKRLREQPAPAAPELLAALDAISPRTPALDAMRAALGGAAASGATAAPATPATPATPSRPTTPPAPRPTSHSESDGEGDLDAIFRMVDTGAAATAAGTPAAAPSREQTARHLDALIAALGVTRRSAGTIPRAELARLGAALDEALAGEVRSALHHPAFEAIEAAWLGLRFLIRRADFRSGLRVHVVACDLASLPAAMREAVAPLAAESQAEGRAVCAVAALAAGTRDLGLLAEAAVEAEAARVPLVLDADAALLGLSTLRALPAGERIADLLAAHAGDAWPALRERPEARWVALAMNRVLLRAPYGEHHERVRDFGFEEHPAGAEAHWAWGAASWLVAARIAARAAETGWAVDVAGPPEEATGDLPVRPLELPTGETVNLPLESLLSEPRALECSEAGLVPLVCRRNHDAAWIPAAPTLAAARGRDEARRASLAHALWLAHLTALLAKLHGALDPAAPREQRVAGLAKGLEFLAFGDDGPLLEVASDDPGEGPVTLSIRPIRPPLAGLPETTVEVPV